MNNSRMRSTGGGQRRISIKDRVGAPKRPVVVKAKGKLQVKLASRLGLPVKSRIGAGGKAVGKGKITDAREKIILNRVSKGRVGMDARAKIEAKRMTKKVLGGAAATKGNANKLKSLRITANVGGRSPLVTPSRARAGMYRGGGGPSLKQGPVSEGYFANEPFQNQRQLRVSVPSGPRGGRGGGGGRPLTLRADDNLFLTRTVTNYQANVPSTSAAGNRSWHSSVAKVAPSFARGGYGYVSFCFYLLYILYFG